MPDPAWPQDVCVRPVAAHREVVGLGRKKPDTAKKRELDRKKKN